MRKAHRKSVGFRVSKNPKPSKREERRLGGFFIKVAWFILGIVNNDSLKSGCIKRFDFLRKPKPTVPYVRRRHRFAWLWRFFDL